MHSLRFFGGLHLENAPELLTGRAAQRKRLALLALLGIGSRSVSRDRLIGMLWPDADEERARPLLASAVYDLRRVLGEDCILSAGDDLRLNPHRITTDVWQFDEALAGRDWARAAAIYRGPLLDGFFVSGALELERWIDDERRRCARAWMDACEKCAEELERAGEHRAAASYWDRLASAEPLSARIVMRLMRSLAAAGEPAAVLACVRAYEGRVRAEELVPDPAVAELAAELARHSPPVMRPPTPGQPTSSAAPPAAAVPSPHSQRVRAAAGLGVTIALIALVAVLTSSRSSVNLVATGVLPDTPHIVIADVGSGDDDARAITEWLRTDLSQSPYLRPLPPRRVAAALKRMQRNPDTLLTTALALEVGRREGAAGVVGSELARIGDRYVVTAVLTAMDGSEVFRTRQTARRRADLLEAVTNVSADLRRALGESRSSLRASPPLPRVTSTSVEALLLFRRSHDPALRLDDRIALLERALRYDPTFTAAHQRLASTAASAGQAVRAAYHARKAFENSERLPEPERSYAVGYYHDVALGDRTGAIAAFRAITERYPRSVLAQSYHADLLLREQRWAEAERAAPIEIRLAPQAYAGHSNLMYAQLAQRKFGEARRTIAAADSLSPWGRKFLALHYAEATRDYAYADRWLDSLEAGGDTDPYQIWSHRMDFALARGGLAQAAAIAAQRFRTAPQRLEAAATVGRLRLRLLADTAGALAIMEAALRRDPLDSIPVIDRPYVPLAALFADAGQSTRARRYLREFAASPAYHSPHAGDAAVARAEGRFREAAQAYERLNERDSPAECTYMYAFELGFTHELAGEVRDAIAAYEQGVQAFGCQYRDGALGAAYLALSRLHARAGNFAHSQRYADMLRKLWGRADPDVRQLIPETRRAVAEGRRF